MNHLLNTVKTVINKHQDLPFSVYTSLKEQQLLNVPIIKPLLIIVLSGEKKLGTNHELTCSSGRFIFLSNRSAINMRNIPKNNEYFALLIEFDHQDFSGLQVMSNNKKDHVIGTISSTLTTCLQQFVDIAPDLPRSTWSLRKREIIELLCHTGHNDILSLLSYSSLKERLHEIFINQSFSQLQTPYICEQLGMSESTLRRKLKQEGTSMQELKDQAKLGLSLHLLQTTNDAIGLIADKCGYQSQSRFTDRFKKHFGLTPSQLRKTKMAD